MYFGTERARFFSNCITTQRQAADKSVLLRVLEGRYNVAHGACRERSEGKAVGKRMEDDRKTPTKVTLGIQPLEISSTSGAIHRHGDLDARDKIKV